MRTIIILLACATTAQAGGNAALFGRVFGRRCRPAAKVIVQQVAVPVVPVAFVLAPSQPASYGAAEYRPPLRDPSRSATSSASLGGDLTALTKVVAELQKEVRSLRGQLGAQTPDGEIPQIVRQHCGKCHSGSAADGDGITFAALAGPKNDRAQLEVIKGTMPKRADEAEPIVPEVRQALVAALEEMRR